VIRRAIVLGSLLPYAAIATGLGVFRSAWLAMALYHAGILAVMVVGSGGRIGSLLRGWSAVPAAFAVGFGASGAILLRILWPHAVRDGFAARLLEIGLHGESFVAFAFYHALVNPWLEEWYWRGWLGSAARGPVLRDAAFAGYHLIVLTRFLDWPWATACFVALTVAAWVWRRLAARCGGLLVPVLSHVAGGGGAVAAALVST
jgi:hypothetical protein